VSAPSPVGDVSDSDTTKQRRVRSVAWFTELRNRTCTAFKALEDKLSAGSQAVWR